MGYLMLQGTKVFRYLEDILFSVESKEALLAHINLAVNTLTQAEFFDNLAKSSLNPTQDMVIIRALLHMAIEQVSLLPDKALCLSQQAHFKG